MTRISGERIIATLCCGAEFRTPVYASINLSAHERWTDGRATGSLFDNGGGLRRCKCGSYFLINNATSVGQIPRKKPRAPKNWEKKSVSLWFRYWGFPTREHILNAYDTREPAVIDAEEKQYSYEFHVLDSDLANVIFTKKLPPEIEIIARRRYWRYLNDNYRETYRHAREIDSTAIPVYTPTAQQIENMKRLLRLLQDHHTQDWIEISELMRELGDPIAAKNVLQYAKEYQVKDVDLQNKLISQGLNGPVRFRYR